MRGREEGRKTSASGFTGSFSVLCRNEGSLYPDTEIPERIEDLPARVDFIARLCAAWDFGILPLPGTIEEIRKGDWREAVDRCRLLTSPSYHLVRKWHGLPGLPYLGVTPSYIRDDPSADYV